MGPRWNRRSLAFLIFDHRVQSAYPGDGSLLRKCYETRPSQREPEQRAFGRKTTVFDHIRDTCEIPAVLTASYRKHANGHAMLAPRGGAPSLNQFVRNCTVHLIRRSGAGRRLSTHA